MSSFDLEPDKVFSQQQWVQIAQSIERDDIPHDAKQRICDALLEYTMSTIKPDELNRFVEEVRKFRAAASRIQNFLRSFRWHEKIEELIEDIHQLRRFVEDEYKRRPNPKGARPKLAARDSLVDRLYLVHEDLTGKNLKTGKLTGAFRFISKIFQFQGIELRGLKRAIATAAKNRS